MSFTSLFIALSRRMGVETFMVSVAREPQVEKVDDLVVVSRHVVAGYSGGGVLYLYDFYLSSEAPYLSRRAIDDVKASAMFHTNLGGAAIREGNLELAREHLETAAQLDPELASAWVNLGVVRARSGDARGALDAYDRALRTDPDHTSALTNMAYVYQQRGQTEEARAALRAAAEGRSSPFTLIALADVEAGRGHFDLARGFLNRARRMYRKVPEVYDALARLERRAGDPLAGERYERKAAALRRKIREAREAEMAKVRSNAELSPRGSSSRFAGRRLRTYSFDMKALVVAAVMMGMVWACSAGERPPAVAGSFYPDDPDELRAAVRGMLERAGPAPAPAVALVVPHAGYVFSGEVAARGFAALRGARPQRVILLGPSHHAASRAARCRRPGSRPSRPPSARSRSTPAPWHGCARAPSWAVPPAAHDPEHCLEVELPFLAEVGAGGEAGADPARRGHRPRHLPGDRPRPRAPARRAHGRGRLHRLHPPRRRATASPPSAAGRWSARRWSAWPGPPPSGRRPATCAASGTRSR